MMSPDYNLFMRDDDDAKGARVSDHRGHGTGAMFIVIYYIRFICVYAL